MRIVVKVGTSTLAYPTGRLNIQRMERLCKTLSDLKNAGHEIILVSSGAIAMGFGKLNLSERPKDMPGKQASAAVGQCELMYVYDKLFTEYNHTVAQLLITAPDIEEGGVRKQNFHNTLARLLELGALPVINENDTISTEEFGIGDNDTLSTVLYVALQLGRPLLIEGAAGVGKTEVAKVMAAALDRELVRLREAGAALLDQLPSMRTAEGADCAAIIAALRRELARRETENQAQRRELTAYYTAWVHQIKTPIAAMKLTLQGQDDPAARRLRSELGRVEQYVDMVLTYLRLHEGGSDYVIRKYKVDDIVRPAVRRFAGEFIDRRIALEYRPIGRTVVTDEKWLRFVVEQVLSNALKYTPEGGRVAVTWQEEGQVLCISDTGIGIAPEDLPRVFEMGYTGTNGRMDRHASGIGLYLCRRICQNLGHTITARSAMGQGTTVYIGLKRREGVLE